MFGMDMGMGMMGADMMLGADMMMMGGMGMGGMGMGRTGFGYCPPGCMGLCCRRVMMCPPGCMGPCCMNRMLCPPGCMGPCCRPMLSPNAFPLSRYAPLNQNAYLPNTLLPQQQVIQGQTYGRDVKTLGVTDIQEQIEI